MKKLYTSVAVSVALFTGLVVGYAWESSKVQVACESTDEYVNVGGKQYLCMTKDQIKALVEYIKNHTDNGI